MRELTSVRLSRWTRGTQLVALATLVWWTVFVPAEVAWTVVLAAALIGSAVVVAVVMHHPSTLSLWPGRQRPQGPLAGYQGGEMRKLLCCIFGHERLATAAAHRVCLRCGQREKRRRLAAAALPGSARHGVLDEGRSGSEERRAGAAA
jgi:hypothetical protein